MRYRVEAKESDKSGRMIQLLPEDEIQYVEAGDYQPSEVSIGIHVAKIEFDLFDIGDMVEIDLRRVR